MLCFFSLHVVLISQIVCNHLHRSMCPYQAVSSMKMPSFSSCMNSSPPGDKQQYSWMSGISVKESSLQPILHSSLLFVLHLFEWSYRYVFTNSGPWRLSLPLCFYPPHPSYHSDTPVWGRAFPLSGRRTEDPRWMGVSPSPGSPALLEYGPCLWHYKLSSPKDKQTRQVSGVLCWKTQEGWARTEGKTNTMR